jgi:hypothetical protein
MLVDIYPNLIQGLPMLRACRNVVIGAIACWPVLGSACVYPPPSPQRANETDAQYKARTGSEFEAYLSASSKETEASYFGQADRIFFARIIRSEEINVGGSPYARRIVVKPLQAIKGALPSRPLILKDRELTSCGLGGDGPATWGGVGHVAIVFEGVQNEGMEYRSQRYAVLASEASEPKLVKAWAAWRATANFTFDQ